MQILENIMQNISNIKCFIESNTFSKLTKSHKDMIQYKMTKLRHLLDCGISIIVFIRSVQTCDSFYKINVLIWLILSLLIVCIPYQKYMKPPSGRAFLNCNWQLIVFGSTFLLENNSWLKRKNRWIWFLQELSKFS